MLSRFQEQGYSAVSRLVGRGFNYITDIIMQTAIRVKIIDQIQVVKHKGSLITGAPTSSFIF